MRFTQLPTRVVTFKLAAALERYELEMRALLADTWVDLACLQRLQAQFGELRMLCASLPKLSVSWVAVLLSRAKLVDALCRRAGPAAAELLQEHLEAVEGLRKRCLRTMGAQAVVLT
jgi:hypothetical protein